jgi:lipoprotein signal peptidase
VDLGFWPVFNLADAALWVGIGLLVLASVREGTEG